MPRRWKTIIRLVGGCLFGLAGYLAGSIVYAQIVLDVGVREDGIQVDCDYNTALFDASTMQRFLGHLRSSLSTAAAGLVP